MHLNLGLPLGARIKISVMTRYDHDMTQGNRISNLG